MAELLTIKEASKWASEHLNKNVTKIIFDKREISNKINIIFK